MNTAELAKMPLEARLKAHADAVRETCAALGKSGVTARQVARFLGLTMRETRGYLEGAWRVGLITRDRDADLGYLYSCKPVA